MFKEGDIVELTVNSTASSGRKNGSVGRVVSHYDGIDAVRVEYDDGTMGEYNKDLRKVAVLFPKHYKGLKSVY